MVILLLADRSNSTQSGVAPSIIDGEAPPYTYPLVVVVSETLLAERQFLARRVFRYCNRPRRGRRRKQFRLKSL